MALPCEPCTHLSTQSERFLVFCKCRKEPGVKRLIDIEMSGFTLQPRGYGRDVYANALGIFHQIQRHVKKLFFVN